MPSTLRGWLQWSYYVLESQARPFSPRYEFLPPQDFRTKDSRETALSVKIMLERASAECTRNGVGVELLLDLYVREASWYSFSEREKQLIRRTEKVFRCSLCAADFLPPCGRPRRGCTRGEG